MYIYINYIFVFIYPAGPFFHLFFRRVVWEFHLCFLQVTVDHHPNGVTILVKKVADFHGEGRDVFGFFLLLDLLLSVMLNHLL